MGSDCHWSENMLPWLHRQQIGLKALGVGGVSRIQTDWGKRGWSSSGFLGCDKGRGGGVYLMCFAFRFGKAPLT